MSHTILLTLNDLDIATSALEILDPDTAEGHALVEKFGNVLREKTNELQSAHRESCADPALYNGPTDEILIEANENAWAALADGLDVMSPDDADVADMAASLAGRIRVEIERPSPSI